MDDPLNPPDQAPADDTPINNAVETDATTTIARGRPTDEPEEDTETPSSTSTTATPVRETETSTRSTATTISTRRTTISDEATTSTSDTETETKSSSTTESTSTTERSTSTKPALSSETTETSTTPSTISSSTAESTTTSTETSSRIEERPTTRELKPSRPSIDPSPTRLPSKGEAQGDGLGTGTIIGIALAGFVGAGLLVLLIGALLRWRRKRLIAKKSEGLPAFKTILDFADTASDKDSITNANRKAAEDISTVPVTPPYRPEMRQPSKRQSWYDDPQNSEPQNVDDYTFQPTNGPPPQGGHALARANTGQYKHGNQRALATDDYMPEYANHGAVRPPPQLIPGMHGSQQGGGAFDHLRGQNWCGQYPQPDMRDAYNDRRDGAPVRNRHFPTAPGRSYTSDNPYPFVPTAHNR